MEKRIRRNLHQVWCDSIDKGLDYSTQDEDWVWYDGKVWKVGTIVAINDFILISPNDKERVNVPDIDWMYENCYEVFEEELKALTVLYGKKVL